MVSRKRIGMDLALRAGGVALLCVAALIAYLLFGAGARAAVAIDYLLAAVGFVSVSAGSALAWQGRHLSDQIALSSRWTLQQTARADPVGPARSSINNRAIRSAASSR